MGVATLKKKKELHYRRGTTWQKCAHCRNYKELSAAEPRCKVIGLEGGRLFRISERYVCDAFEK